jgi:ribosome biogenesis GTPase / thiamine phosphate phosphatase
VSRSDRGGSLIVETADGPERARLPASFRRLPPTELPIVGDWVTLGADRIDGSRVVEAVLARRSVIIRQAPEDRAADAQALAANVDIVLIVMGLGEAAGGNGGDVNLRRLDRYLALAWNSGASPVVVLTKSDCCTDTASVIAEVELATLGVPVLALSGLTGEGIELLDPYLLPGTTAVLLGMSGAGKSTLANRLLGADALATQAVRGDGRGRHTTTHRELLRLPCGALLIDTPGLRELGLWDAGEGLSSTFRDVEELAASCRFGDCQHDSEPGCAVHAALAKGRLTAERLESYRKLEREAAYQARKQDARLRKAEVERWKQIDRSMRALRSARGH